MASTSNYGDTIIRWYFNKCMGKYALMAIQQVHTELTQALWLMCNKFKLVLSGIHTVDRVNRKKLSPFKILLYLSSII